MFEYGKADYSYSDSLQQVSYEMKHNRASITEHYLEDDFYTRIILLVGYSSRDPTKILILNFYNFFFY